MRIQRSSRFRRGAVGAAAGGFVLGLLVTSSAAVPAQAGPAQAGSDRTPVAVAMGDSFMSGEGAQFAGSIYNFGVGVEPGRMAADKGAHNHGLGVFNRDQFGGWISDRNKSFNCHRSDTAQINRVQTATGQRAINLACSGATTNNILERGQHGERPQLEQLRQVAKDESKQIKTVVVSIGGNDLGFGDVLADCTEIFSRGRVDCGSNGSQAKLEKRGGNVKERITATLDAISGVMRDNGYADGDYTFVYQGGPNLFAGSHERRTEKGPVWQKYHPQSPGVPMSNGTVNWTRNGALPYVNDLMGDAARAADNDRIRFLDLSGAFRGHELSSTSTHQIKCNKSNTSTKRATCSKSPAPNAANAEWIVPLDSDFVIGNVLGTDRMQQSYHPNRFGQQAIGDCLVGALKIDRRAVTCSGSPHAGPFQMTVRRR